MKHMAGITDFFKKAIDALGIDIVFLLSVLVVGISLAILSNGGTTPDTQAATFALIFCMMGIVVLFVAVAARVSKGTYFIGAEDTIIPQISPKNFPILGLLYLIFGTIIGVLLAAGALIFATLFRATESFSTTNFVFQGGFSPIIETYFYQGLLMPIFETLLVMRLGMSFPMRALAFVVALIIQALMATFVHIVALGGNPAYLTGTFIFFVALGVAAKVFGILMAIGLHSGYNIGVLFNSAQSIFITR